MSAGRCESPARKSVALKVLPTRVRKSRMGWKRAIVLALVHVAFVIHLVQWWISGMRDGVRETLAPLEPSESMYTLELGLVNVGFVLFALAILSTLLFGRFFCGWGCHIIALQDACGWLMKKLGVHPKPFRTRLLLFMPLVMGLYMFVWPTLKREVVWPLWEKFLGPSSMDALAMVLGARAPSPFLQAHFIVEDFWKTFAPWYIGIPFLLICGCATVYFLGNKAFCTYACPYGGLFAPADLFSVGKIVVNDRCEQCGHCTAVCSSNVRVHEEVHAFGKVVDPGCMKCMDCVSVCPNDALSFAFSSPSLTTSARKDRAKPRKIYDTTPGEEFVLGAIFIFLTFFGFRGMLDAVPLLLSAGLGCITTFLVWKAWRLVRTPSVRLAHQQMKVKGRVTPTGWLWALCAVLLLALGVWGGVVSLSKVRAGYIEWDVKTPTEKVLSRGYVPEARDEALATRALRLFELADSPRLGGIGWELEMEELKRTAWLHAVRGDLDKAETTMHRVLDQWTRIIDRASSAGPRSEARHGLCSDVLQLVTIRHARGDSDEQIESLVQSWIDKSPEKGTGTGRLSLALARSRLTRGKLDEGKALIERALEADRQPKGFTATAAEASNLYLQLGERERALEIAREAVQREPKAPAAHLALAIALTVTQRGEEALESFAAASRLSPANPTIRRQAAELATALGRGDEAARYVREAERIESKLGMRK